jgi:hypothetical protein
MVSSMPPPQKKIMIIALYSARQKCHIFLLCFAYAINIRLKLFRFMTLSIRKNYLQALLNRKANTCSCLPRILFETNFVRNNYCSKQILFEANFVGNKFYLKQIIFETNLVRNKSCSKTNFVRNKFRS